MENGKKNGMPHRQTANQRIIRNEKNIGKFEIRKTEITEINGAVSKNVVRVVISSRFPLTRRRIWRDDH